MSDLISRLSELRSQYNCFEESERGAYHTLSEAIEALKEQKTGRWIKGIIGWNCSECTLGTNQNWFNYCPNCGARME